MAYEMTATIAENTYRRNRSDGVTTEITVRFGLPSQVPEDKDLPGYWYCPYQILGIGIDDEVLTGVGTSSLGALCLAIGLPGTLLSALPYAQELELFGVPNLGFPRMFKPK